MINLMQLLREWDAGELLWADPQRMSTGGYGKLEPFIRRLYKGELEPDTPEEKAAYQALMLYVNQNNREMVTQEMIKELLRIKSRFPKILDPGLSGSKMVWRGMTMPTDELVQLLSGVKRVTNQGSYWHWRLPKVQHTTRSRAEGFMSFSADREVALRFTNHSTRFQFDRWPVTIGCPYSMVADRALFNPKFMNAIASAGIPLPESEFWVQGQDIPVTEIFITPTNVANASRDDKATLAAALDPIAKRLP